MLYERIIMLKSLIASEKTRNTLIIFVCFVIYAGYKDYSPKFFDVRYIELEVTRVETAKSCRRKGKLFQGPRTRSVVVERPLFNFCGVVYTNIGYFTLPETARINWPFPSRENLENELETGCIIQGRFHSGNMYGTRPKMQYLGNLSKIVENSCS